MRVQGTRYVRTDAILEAVKGHESQVLDALGIPWSNGRPHITCPYPDHPDADPSWRWDQEKSRAFCTCAAKGDSIFDVIMKCQSIDFDAAKIRVAEMIGCDDLIIDGEKHQPFTAGWLLAPSLEERDDELVFKYLGRRLGIEPDQVPRPSTPVAGWRALEYFDQAFRESYPAAIFGTRDGHGREHAHRIYLALGGAGKADIPAGPVYEFNMLHALEPDNPLEMFPIEYVQV